MSKKTKALKKDIENLRARVEVLEFKEEARGQKYVAKWDYSKTRIVISFIHEGRVVYDYKSFHIHVRKPTVVGDYVEVYADIFGGGCLEVVYTQHDDRMVEVDLNLYKKAKAYDVAAKADAEEKENGM